LATAPVKSKPQQEGKKPMLVGKRMTMEPITVDPEDLLSRAAHKMQAGGFRRLPVVSGGKLVGIITDRDVRQYRGHLEHKKIKAAMTESPLIVTPETTLEEAAVIMLEQQIGGLPVVEEGRLVGVIAASDILRAFLDVMGASHGGSTRIDFILEGEEHGFTEASRIVAREGGEILGVGTYRDKLGDNPVCYLRLAASHPEQVAKGLRVGGFKVLGVHHINA
jgi:acetoin utilization protein AcuB